MTKSNQKKSDNSTNQRDVSKGGWNSITPPAKISLEDENKLKVLTSNIDTLVLSIDIAWQNNTFFKKLSDVKKLAKYKKKELPISFKIPDLKDEYIFNIKEYGAKGYEWILTNQEYSLLIGNWERPQSRPSILITFRSETLWRKGLYEAVLFIMTFLEKCGGKLKEPKVSRIDLCIDVLFPKSLWNIGLIEKKVTRASDTAIYISNKSITGISIGKGQISARLYDKPLEIKQKSNGKVWLYDIWKIKEIPEDFKIIRIEFQLRRETIKELRILTMNNLFNHLQDIWAYCTEKWLKFQDNPGKQSHQRKTYTWWKTIQNSFLNIQDGVPLIRCKAVNVDKTAIAQQILGLMSSYAAVETNSYSALADHECTLSKTFVAFKDHTFIHNLMGHPFKDRVINKKAKYQRINDKMINSIEFIEPLSFLDDMPDDDGKAPF